MRHEAGNRILALALAFLLAPALWAQDEPDEAAESTVQEVEGEEAAEEPAELSTMQRIRLAISPGEKHELLEPLVGDWSLTYRIWVTRDGEPVETYGTAENRWILEKRFIRMVYRGEVMGRDFEGERVLGYDNQAQEYVATWRDNQGTFTLLFKGRCDDLECRQRTMYADFVDPVSGQRLRNKGIFHLGRPMEPEEGGEVEGEDAGDGGEASEGDAASDGSEATEIVRRVVWSDDNDAFTYESFLVTSDGKEFKNLEIVAERR